MYQLSMDTERNNSFWKIIEINIDNELDLRYNKETERENIIS